jgi:N-acetylglucosaminyl-diphospho-decaprenol L-rhamnosyltransferase
MTSVSVVVPTARAGADLNRCLRSLAGQDVAGLEIVVVDNGSPGVSADGVRVLRNQRNTGFVDACNQGITASTGELILLLNDDTVVGPGALHALVGALEQRPEWGACQAKLLLLDDPTRLDTAGSFLTSTGFLVHRGAFGPADEFTETDEVFAAKGAALLVRRRALDDAGPLDPAFFAYFEETDLCWRLWLTGWAVGFVADAPVLHALGRTASELPSAFVQFHSYKNRIRTLVKNLGAARLAWMLPYHVLLCLALVVWYAVRGRFAVSRGILCALWWNAVHLRDTLRQRRSVQARRRVSDRELMPRVMRRVSLRTLLFYAR